MLTRREFVKRTGTLAAISSIGLTSTIGRSVAAKNRSMLPVTIHLIVLHGRKHKAGYLN